jgi:hypothetical protein
VPTYPVVERHGLLHVHRGAAAGEVAFDLPFFAGCDPADFVAGRPFRLEADCPWYMVGANGFDEHHFAPVHGRTHVAPPQVTQPHPAALRVVHEFAVTGDALQDRVTRRLWGRRAQLDFTCWGGTLVVGTMSFEGFTSYLLVFVQPLGPSRCVVDFVVYRPRRAGPLGRVLRSLELRVLRRVSQGFFRHEVESLQQGRIRPAHLVESDALLKRYLTWLVDWTQGGASARSGEAELDGRVAPSEAPTSPSAHAG